MVLAERLWALGHDTLWAEGFSHPLAKGMFDYLPVDVAAFTQLGMDHLGSHRSLALYRAAKERLFRSILSPDGTVVLDPRSPGGTDVAAIAAERGLRVTTTGPGNEVELSNGTLRVGESRFGCRVPFAETVMVANLELAIAASIALGLDPGALAKAAEEVSGPPGRFQVLEADTPFQIVIDSAHNGDALEAALSHWRQRTEGRMLVVVASVGTADPTRWEPIGEVAGVLADVVVVTDESPYGHQADTIRHAILRGCPPGHRHR